MSGNEVKAALAALGILVVMLAWLLWFFRLLGYL
jgi:hypothetical protein